jgi:hypothetical protein
MSLFRAFSIALPLAALAGPSQLGAQYKQPWVGRGISAQRSSDDQVRVARRSTAVSPAAAKVAVPRLVRAARFTITVANISTGDALKLSNGESAPFVSAPVLWVIHDGSTNPIFIGGAPGAGQGLEFLAETGDPSKLVKSLTGKNGIVAVGAAAKPVGVGTEGPLTPGQRYEFEIVAQPGQVLSTAWMFGQSNDLFYSNDRPIPLFDALGKPKSGEMTAQLALWDAGTEVNEEPGLGPNQGPRQKTPNAGVAERQGIARAHDKYSYPRTGDVLRMTITPVVSAMSAK